jgi:glutaminyl-peptide cyclotransferase
MHRTPLVFLTLLFLFGCSPTKTPMPKPEPQPLPQVALEKRAVVLSAYNHDTSAFTQGLIVRNGMFYESTGRNGMSTIRQVDIATGRVKRLQTFDDKYFCEGITELHDTLYVLTWLNSEMFVLNISSLKKEQTLYVAGEGWGLTSDGTHLYKSDGSAVISKLDRKTGAVVGTTSVTYNGQPLANINELEWIDGKIWANIWQTNSIVVFDPISGMVEQNIDASAVTQMEYQHSAPNKDVLNGIAFDHATKSLYVTGKCWRNVYKIQVVDK